MNRLYEKCDCKSYNDENDHRSALIKMELPECVDDNQYGGTGYVVFRALRFIGYVVVLVLLSYSLWRIHVIESNLIARDRLANLTRSIIESNMKLRNHTGEHNGNAFLLRSTRSTDGLTDQNMFDMGKELPKGSMLTAKNEGHVPKRKVVNKEEFDLLVNSLFDKIKTMHDDTDRGHLDKNMKALFQAWFPVFDALLPHETIGNEESRNTRSAIKSSEESSEEKKKPIQKREADKSDESSEEKKQKNKTDKSSEESSGEKKPKQKREVKKSSEESSEEKKPKQKREVKKSSEESSEEKKPKQKSEVDKSSNESSEENKPKTKRSIEESIENISDEQNNKVSKNDKDSLEEQAKIIQHADDSYENLSNEELVRKNRSTDKSSEDSSEEKHKLKHKKYNKIYDPYYKGYGKYSYIKKKKSSDESSDSSQSSKSSKSSEKVDKAKIDLIYRTMKENADASQNQIFKSVYEV